MILLPGLKKNSGTQVAAKNIIKNYRNLAKKKAQKNQTDLADAETIDYNKDTNVSDLNEPLSKKTSSAQIAAKIVKKYKNLSKKKAAISFNISDIADTAIVDYNSNTNINDLDDIAPNKNTNAQIAAKKIAKNTEI